MSTETTAPPPDSAVTSTNPVDSKPISVPDNAAASMNSVDAKPAVIPDNATEENKVDSKSEETFYMSTQNDGASLTSSIINMMNTIIGAGTISLPNTMMISGIAGGGILLIISLLLSLVGAHYLSASSIYSKEDSYGFIGKKIVNPVIGYVADFFMILFDFGISVGYYNIVLSQTMDLLGSFLKKTVEELSSWQWLVSLIEGLFLFFPLLCIPTIDSLKWTSTVAIICISIFVIIAIVMGIIQVFREPLQYNWLPDNFTDLSTAVSVFFTCLCAHVNIPKMTSELKFPTKSKFGNKLKKMDRVNNISFVACTVVYFLVGVCGYLAFGANTKGNLLSNFADLNVWYLNIVKVAYAFVALFSYPVLSFSPLVSIDKTFFKQPRPVSRRVLEAFIWTLLVVIVALLIPELTQVFSLTGSMCGIALVFVWPSLFYIWIDKREKAKKLTSRVDIFKFSSFSIVFAWILFYVGIVAAVFMTVLEIKKLVAA
ncbi:amino acid transporter [Blastocystis sp. subtype 4]|uniref:amino acid transporter n=1 Tax=Blastocystis sp. subtype 4 TaxID=944170 RepID=UPI000711F20D|nr:amino acid transporter [Blastocystis sp. subtype 4]KNB42245.1 amino acid transporter [Blastocystis sp. subtype 4]|eukprot:XP_014525688.1 amino acid transporter [Blastocystis sp. subtype 4]